ncbi:MAG: protein-methionine-sulfoxide reductase heme-binding subunit MsrQ [Lentibacter sp.]|uniref:protein-methionine-sulfoxide reductase heme-binding subunit MsrQ n=1 Tax=Lentibacter sp. TaxID=2024994 RepID=UPI00262F61A6|nr:protein-methionine-sulfoxide reductase heme-binding subunit MsrQ [Lentibacter sp.]MDG1289136.1 protein-methionine-sulfoxide reductase heme-binding subunit MsrQ [Lentibacter sp.]
MSSWTSNLNSVLRRASTAPVYILCMGHICWLFYLGLTGGLGVEPIKALEHAYGAAGLKALVVTLVVTPLRSFAGVNLLKFRRALGLSAFFYIVAHLLVWLLLDVQQIGQIWADILKRPYITVGMAGFALLLPLALTSNNISIRRLGATRWRTLHRLSYPAAILGGVHYVMLVKGFQIEPMLYLSAILGLISLRSRTLGRKTAQPPSRMS